jgi:uncharacterized cupredoxin-like copper-binding protein
MRSIRPLVPALLLLGAAAVAACSGGSGASPSTDPSSAPSAASSAAPSAAGSAASPDASAATRIDVVGTDYAFSEFPAEFSGDVAFAFRNEGQELHEMVIVRRNDDVTETFEELLALPEEESLAKVGFIGQTMAEAGQTAPDTLTATEPGSYLMVCFIPQGTTALPSIDPEASGPPEGLGDGPPHFTLGMQREFTITD